MERKILSRLDALERKVIVLDKLNKDVDAIKRFCNKMHHTMGALRRGTMNEPMFPTAKKSQNGPTTTQK